MERSQATYNDVKRLQHAMGKVRSKVVIQKDFQNIPEHRWEWRRWDAKSSESVSTLIESFAPK